MDKAATKSFHDLLVTHDFEAEAFDVSGREVQDPSEAEMFSFEWKTPNHNYGTVVVLLGDENSMEVYYGDNLGRNMEAEDKKDWYDFLYQIKQFAKRNRQSFELNNISRLKYTMRGMAAIKEGLFEGYYGRRDVSYSDEPKQVRLMIKHNRSIPEGEARHRAIDSIFVETADGERFRVPTRSLTHGKILARHCAEGGTPYDVFGQHINSMINEIGTLGRFIRATQNRNDTYSDDAQEMVGQAVRHYSNLKRKAKRMISQHGYRDEKDSFDPSAISETERFTDTIREMFTVRSIDRRVEDALPILAKIIHTSDNTEAGMKELNQFESWANQVMEGTWALPDTPEAMKDLQTLMTKPLSVGADAVNATEQLYNLVGDDKLFDRLSELAEENPDANIWQDPEVMERLNALVPGLKIDDEVSEDDANIASQHDLEFDNSPSGQDVEEDLDTDGVMATKQSNMSSESIQRLVQLARI